MTDRYVSLRPGTELFQLDEHGMATKLNAPMIDVDGSTDVPVIGQYAGYAIIVKHTGEEYAVKLRDLGYLQASMVSDPRPSQFLPLDLLDAEADAAIAALDAAGPHAAPSDEPDEFGIVASDFLAGTLAEFDEKTR